MIRPTALNLQPSDLCSNAYGGLQLGFFSKSELYKLVRFSLSRVILHVCSSFKVKKNSMLSDFDAVFVV